jgi:hypothetical protein
MDLSSIEFNVNNEVNKIDVNLPKGQILYINVTNQYGETSTFIRKEIELPNIIEDLKKAIFNNCLTLVKKLCTNITKEDLEYRDVLNNLEHFGIIEFFCEFYDLTIEDFSLEQICKIGNIKLLKFIHNKFIIKREDIINYDCYLLRRTCMFNNFKLFKFLCENIPLTSKDLSKVVSDFFDISGSRWRSNFLKYSCEKFPDLISSNNFLLIRWSIKFEQKEMLEYLFIEFPTEFNEFFNNELIKRLYQKDIQYLFVNHLSGY